MLARVLMSHEGIKIYGSCCRSIYLYRNLLKWLARPRATLVSKIAIVAKRGRSQDFLLGCAAVCSKSRADIIFVSPSIKIVAFFFLFGGCWREEKV